MTEYYVLHYRRTVLFKPTLSKRKVTFVTLAKAQEEWEEMSRENERGERKTFYDRKLVKHMEETVREEEKDGQ